MAFFSQDGPPRAITAPTLLLSLSAAASALLQCVAACESFLFVMGSAWGCYAVVGVEHALNAQLPPLTAIMIGVVTACGGGLLRDVIVSDEPLLFKPGQLYVLAVLLGASLFSLLILYFQVDATTAALASIALTFVFRLLAIVFDWKTKSVTEPPPPS